MATKWSTRKERAMELKLLRLQLSQIKERIQQLGGLAVWKQEVREILTDAWGGVAEAIHHLDEIDVEKDV